MYQPESYFVALLFMIGSMCCWGSWANTMKLTPRFPFQLFYWDYIAGLLLGSVLWGLTLGNMGASSDSLLHNLSSADTRHIGFAILAGIIFNVANLLLVAAIDISGMAVAFPIGIGLALVIGVLLNYLIAPAGNPILLFGGMALVTGAIVVDAIAYRRRENLQRAGSVKGVQVSLAAGILMGLFYPFVVKASVGQNALGPYSVTICFAFGVVLCAIPVNAWFMRHSVSKNLPVHFCEYFTFPLKFHLWGLIGGFIWCTGAMFSFVAANTHLVGPAVSYAIGQGATLISAIWGIFIWREFVHAPASSRRLLPLMFLLFIVGLGAIAIAPLIAH